MCDFSDVYIVVKGDITVTESNNAERNKNVPFKNNAPFINCISKINDAQINNAEALHVVMPMYNVYEYSKNQRKRSVVCGTYYRNEPNNLLSSNSESLKYKTSITGNKYNFVAGDADYVKTKVIKN